VNLDWSLSTRADTDERFQSGMDTFEQNIGLCLDKPLILISVVLSSESKFTVVVNCDIVFQASYGRIQSSLASKKPKNSFARASV
jgi:hypothetical protein